MNDEKKMNKGKGGSLANKEGTKVVLAIKEGTKVVLANKGTLGHRWFWETNKGGSGGKQEQEQKQEQ